MQVGRNITFIKLLVRNFLQTTQTLKKVSFFDKDISNNKAKVHFFFLIKTFFSCAWQCMGIIVTIWCHAINHMRINFGNKIVLVAWRPDLMWLIANCRQNNFTLWWKKVLSSPRLLVCTLLNYICMHEDTFWQKWQIFEFGKQTGKKLPLDMEIPIWKPTY